MGKIQEFINQNKMFVALGGFIAIVFLVIFFTGAEKNVTNNLNNFVKNTTIEEAESYKMDLRIFGKYNNKGINKIIMVTNYKDTDKEITITSGEKEEKYLVKEGKKYTVKDEKVSETDKVPYENTEVYLTGANKLNDLQQVADEKIGKVSYKVFKGTISTNDMQKIVDATDLELKVEKNASVEVWLTQDNYVYKIYYRIGDLTIYPSYFGYGKMNKVNLDMYKA